MQALAVPTTEEFPTILGTFADGWSDELCLAALDYMDAHRLDTHDPLRVDVVVMLLRIGTEEALGHVTALTGKPITRCPSAMPPWPPKPVAASAGHSPKVQWVIDENPCSEGTAMRGRFEQLRVGRTREQLLARGITARDLCYWQKKNFIRFE